MKSWSGGAAGILLAMLPATTMAQTRPQTLPTRDVDITYRIARGGQSLQERTRWLAAQEVQRIDPPGNAVYMIIDHRTHRASMVDSGKHTVVDVPAPAVPGPLEAGSGARFVRQGDAVVAGLACTNWEISSGGAPTVVCITADGALLRVQAAGNTLVEAISVNYGPAEASAFAVPLGYQHVAPGG